MRRYARRAIFYRQRDLYLRFNITRDRASSAYVRRVTLTTALFDGRSSVPYCCRLMSPTPRTCLALYTSIRPSVCLVA